MDAAGYFKYSKSANAFCQQFIEELAADWCGTSLKVVMDIGCGPGNTSTYWIDHYFPDIERLIGIDIDPRMIALANEKNTKDKIEFCIADIMKKDSLKKWEGSIDKVVSTFALQRVTDQNQAFRNIFDLLKPSGEAALYFHISGPFYLASMDLYQTPKWKSTLEASSWPFPEAHMKNYDAAHYKQLFEHIGYKVSVCEARSLQYAWESDDDVKNHLMSLNTLGGASEEVKEEYRKDIFESYLKHSSRNSQDHLIHRITVLCAKLCKDAE